jgi:uncharacterized tellurite resistance protein B-like protein
MVYKELFTQQEWKTLQMSVMWVFQAVAGADSKIDKKEKAALQHVIMNSKKVINDLAREVLESIKNTQESIDEVLAADQREMWHGIKEASAILSKKVEQRIEIGFKKTLISIGIHIGESSGSLFGNKFTGDEVEVVKQIGYLLNVSVADLKQPPTIQQMIESIK